MKPHRQNRLTVGEIVVVLAIASVGYGLHYKLQQIEQKLEVFEGTRAAVIEHCLNSPECRYELKRVLPNVE